MQLFNIAFRNLGRSRGRTAVSIVAVAASVIAVLLLKGTVTSILNTMEDSTIRLSSGHVRIIDKQYQLRERLLSLQYPVDGFQGESIDAMIEQLGDSPFVDHVAPRIRFGGMISHKDDLRHVLVIGGVPGIEHDIVRANRYVADGRFFTAGQREAVLGRRLLNRLGLNVGDRFTLVFNTAFGALRGYTFHIVGAFESGLAFLDDGTVFIPLDVAQSATDFGEGATEILLMTEQLKNVSHLFQHVKTTLQTYDSDETYVAIPWYEHNDMMAMLSVGRRIYDVIYAAILFFASFVVINTFVMIVHERRREIGMLSALGLRPRQIRLLFVIEGGLSGFIGSVIGVVIGSPLLWILSLRGISIPGVESVGADLMYPSILYPAFDTSIIGFALVAGVIVTCIAVYLPAREASRLEPTDALRT